MTTRKQGESPFQTAGVAGLGGHVPRCYGFRLRPVPVSVASQALPPYPVKVRDPSRRDFFVFDDGWFSGPAQGSQEFGPLAIDPDGASPGWTWQVTWATEPGAFMAPGFEDEPAALLFDSGNVGAGAAIDSGLLDVSRYTNLLLHGNNFAGTIIRNLTYSPCLDDGTPLWNLSPVAMAVGSFGFVDIGHGAVTTTNCTGFSGPLPRKVKVGMAVGGAADVGRVVLFGRRRA